MQAVQSRCVCVCVWCVCVCVRVCVCVCQSVVPLKGFHSPLHISFSRNGKQNLSCLFEITEFDGLCRKRSNIHVTMLPP